jgi:hypothetical protein
VLVNLAVAIVLGATGMSDIALLAHQRHVFGNPPSDSTVGRALAGLDETLLRRIAAVRARVRAHVWHLLALRPGGFPWLAVAGKLLVGWIVIDIDATLITARPVVSERDGTTRHTRDTHRPRQTHHKGRQPVVFAGAASLILRPKGSNPTF